MKYSLALLALLVPLTLTASLGEEALLEETVPVYIETLQELLRPPPLRATRTRANVQTRWISQRLDNNSPDDARVWNNRILINEDHFQSGSPIFIYFGGEWRIDAGPITSGLWVDIAKQHKGSLVYTEHRFYGDSIPITPLTVENLKYLSVQQALADIHNIILELKGEEKYKNSKVVISGCSYSATMTVFYKKLYPNDVVGGWASSAPLEAKVDFKEYMQAVGDDYHQLGAPGCYNIINNATSHYENLFRQGKGETAKNMLNLCSLVDVDNERDRWLSCGSIANTFGGIVQNQKAGDLYADCTVLRNFDEDDAIALSKFLKWHLNQKNTSCVNTNYQSSVDWFKWYMHNGNDTELSWFYQKCSQLGWFLTSTSSNQPFGSYFPASLNTDMCHDVFGYTLEQIEANIQQTNNEFGGKNPNVTNVYITHGALDPWHTLGAGIAQGATIIPNHSHCSDLDSISHTDAPELIASKQRLIELVAQWLA